MNGITLAQAEVIVNDALTHARNHQFKPLTVAVLDAGGHLVVLKREDNSGILRPQIALGKAWGTLGMGTGSRELAKRAETHPSFMAALSDASGGRVIPVPGGVLVRDAQGNVIGAVGVSGDQPQNDEACAVAGIIAAGLTPDVG
jgi:uncharacterized protein GlcG (DUF336 family)